MDKFFVYYTYDAIISTIMIFRVYLVFNYLVKHSRFSNERCENICNENMCDFSSWFVIKAEIEKRPFKVLALLLGVSFLAFGYIMKIYEEFDIS